MKNISDQLVDCAIILALYTLPGTVDTDKNTRAAYRSLATDIITTRRRQIASVIPIIKTMLITRKQTDLIGEATDLVA